jgi:hypothetical protein
MLGVFRVTRVNPGSQCKSSERLSVLLRKERSDRGKSHLTKEVDHIIDAAIHKVYLTAESPQMAAVIEEV